jgi:hypothetical protein
MRGTFSEMAGTIKDRKVTLDFVIKGGVTLAKHLADEPTVKKIKEGKWTHVVLQEQSQTPSLGGTHEMSFHDSVKKLSALIKEAGARPVLYMSWGRRDGDKANATLNPDYETMQKRLTAAYTKAAKDNDCLLVPVGEVWASVRKADPELGKALYAKDGSHPADKGAFLISCVFMNVLLDVPVDQLRPGKGINEKEAATILNAVKELKLSK